MRLPRFRIRTLMITVAVVAALLTIAPIIVPIGTDLLQPLIHLVFCRWLGFQQKDGEATFPYDHPAF